MTSLALIAALLAAPPGPAERGWVAPPRFAHLSPDERQAFPVRLSETGVFSDLRSLTPAPGLVAYYLNVPFWSDGAAKRRWIAVPDGKTIRFSPTEEWSFPVGTVLVKHFERRRDGDAVPLETRILVCDGRGGVRGASYRWRHDGSDADIVATGTTEPAADSHSGWYFPGPDDCRKCHLPAAGGVLGVNARQLNRDTGGENQLIAWNRLGQFDGFDEATLSAVPTLTATDDASAGLETRARSYLDANCGYCHRPGGAVADFDARFTTPLARQNLIGVPARINLGVDGARFVAPNDPWRSMVLVRTGMLGPTGMPPLAHQSIDARGLELLRAWVESLPGDPTLPPPTIESAGHGFPHSVTIRHDDPRAVVRYTLDGGTPGKSSAAYRGPIELTGPTTVRARAYRPGWNRSIAVHATFVD